ncbi:MAG: tetraacyldisaccharide 4'-kinase [Candidatus Rokuibacteriota bacterium]|nr:MAG: tetraacyldisaccharide 4'-kinase [Candidatus Rokubacteria bacterium]
MMAPRRDPEILLRRYWEKPDTPVVTALLSLLSLGYRVGLAARDCAYRYRLLSTGRLSCPVVSIGNVTLGGSGKTPLVEVVALGLRELGAQPAVLSRGYGRDSRGVHVVADRDALRLGPRAAGDEPVLLAERLPGVPVIVGENRFEAGRVALEQCGATAIVLDDGFQHRTLRKDFEILAINGRTPWGNGRLFPRGMLREPLSAVARADLVVVIDPPSAAAAESVERVIRHQNRRAPLLVSRYEVIEARDQRTGLTIAPDDLNGRRFLAFAGLGSPGGFGETLTSSGVRVAGLQEYPDHYWFTEADLTGLATHAVAMGTEGLITTEKDWVRLRGLRLPSLPILVLSVRLRLESDRDVLLQALGRMLAAAPARR